ncbi:MAG: hypothetical protein R2822_03725 [Spirosomataceae bacterium]
MLNQSFSKRHGLNSQEKEITVRQDAPQGLREYVIQTIESLGYGPAHSRQIICRVLRKVPDRNNWTAYPNIYNEVVDLISECEWFYVYDVIEGLYHSLKEKDKLTFENEINDFFILNGIGWKIANGIIEIRGDENFEIELSAAVTTLDKVKLDTAKTEIREALIDLSRRPEPDITGAIQHSLACLECVARHVVGNSKMTLGELIKKHPDIVPKPLDEAISKVWGFTSEQGRHLREGGQPTYEEAELVVGLSAVLTTYLGKKFKPATDEEDLPF